MLLVGPPARRPTVEPSISPFVSQTAHDPPTQRHTPNNKALQILNYSALCSTHTGKPCSPTIYQETNGRALSYPQHTLSTPSRFGETGRPNHVVH
jgi:hypothetical protein